MQRILIAGSAREDTGFGRVVRAIAGALAVRYDVHVLGHDVFGPAPADGWTLHGGCPTDIFALARLGPLTARLDPRLILIVNDYYFLPAYLERLPPSARRPALAAYIPIDAPSTDVSQFRGIPALDAVAVYTHFARSVLDSALPSRPPTRVIPHAAVHQVFQTMPGGSRMEARCALSQRLGRPDLCEEGFWVLNANKNSNRKRLDLTMHGFALFARGKPANVRLYIHSGRRDTGPDLLRLARNLELGDRLILTGDSPQHPSIPLADLNLVYNSCDAGINTSLGEGWGLVSFEHASTDAAQILPRHSSLPELWEDAAEFIEPTRAKRFGCHLEGQEVAPEAVADALERLYTDPVRLGRLSRAAQRNTARPEFSIERVGRQWQSFVAELV